MIREGPAAHDLAFLLTMAFTAVLYFNFAWFREQFCVVLCPYGRLQSVLHDATRSPSPTTRSAASRAAG